MIAGRASRAIAASLLALSLGGCVAAAIPALAGAALVRTGSENKDKVGTLDESTPAEVGTATNESAAPPQSESLSSQAASEMSAERAFAEALGLPTDVATTTAQAEPNIADMPTPYADLFEYVSKVTASGATQSPKLSAVLSEPSALDGKRKTCETGTPLVLIDLDPYEGKPAEDGLARSTPATTDGLQSMRDGGIAIAWISQGTAGDAGAIRTALTKTRLDPDGEDRLILMRYPDDRKQTRREELAQDHCIIAIAGDNREDFDELYEYLVKPEAGEALEPLIGEGWFLVPPPLGKAE